MAHFVHVVIETSSKSRSNGDLHAAIYGIG